MAHPTIDQTILLAAQLHYGQRDKAGVPYLAHVLAVMRRVPERSWHVAVLHDAIEDGKTTAEQLLMLDYDLKEVGALNLLTRRPPFKYKQYIETIAESGDVIAIEVKIADLRDNMDLTRHRAISNDLYVRYTRASQRLITAFNELASAEEAS